MAYVIQIEKVSDNINDTIEDIRDIYDEDGTLLYKDMIVDDWEDGCVVGFGYNKATELLDNDFDKVLNEMINTITSLGGKVDKYGNVYFTNDFVNNLFKNAYEKFVKNSSFEQFLSINTKTLFKTNTIFDDVDIYSDTLSYCENDFLTLAREKFISANSEHFSTNGDIPNISVDETIPYRIIAIFDCWD